MNSSNPGDFVTGLQDAVRQNPVSAALVGVGLLWMFTGGNRLTTAAAILGPAARSVGTGARSGVQHSMDAVARAGEGIRSVGARVADGVQETVSDAASTIGNTTSRAVETIKTAAASATSEGHNADSQQRETFQAFGGALQKNLMHTFDRQPLLLGAIGLAIGAGMAAAFATTQSEMNLLGETADEVISQVKDVASSTADRVSVAASRTMEAVKQEAAIQGLSVDAAKVGAEAIADKVKSIAMGGRARP